MGAPEGNKFALGNTGGKPPYFNSVDEMGTKISQFFEDCYTEKIKATITGLTLYLGFQSRSSLDDYATKNDEYSYIIKRAKLAVENSYEMSGQMFDIFALKNMGWKDKSETELSGGLQIQQITGMEIK